MTCPLSIEVSATDFISDPGVKLLSTSPFRLVGSRLCRRIVMDEIDTLMQRVAGLRASGALARKGGEEAAAEGYFCDALELAMLAASRMTGSKSHPDRLRILQTSALLALDCGEIVEARRLIEEAAECDPSVAFSDEWAQLRDV